MGARRLYGTGCGPDRDPWLTPTRRSGKSTREPWRSSSASTIPRSRFGLSSTCGPSAWPAADLANSAHLVTRMFELTAGTESEELALMCACARARLELWRGKLAESADAAQQVSTLYDPLRHRTLFGRNGVYEAGVAAISADSWRLWLQGYPAQAAARACEARELAERFGDHFGRVYAWSWSLGTLQFRGEAVHLEGLITDVHRVSAEQGFPLWTAWATFFEGWVAGARANEADGIALMERGLDAWRGAGARIGEPYLLALLSETCLRAGRIETAGERLAEARDRVEKTGERWWEAELHRLEGEVLLAAADDGGRDGTPATEPRPASEAPSRSRAGSRPGLSSCARLSA